MQEVETGENGEQDILGKLSLETGMQSIPGLTMFIGNNQYGNSILTRKEVIEVQRHDISIKGREPRGALCVKISSSDKTVSVIATHLGLLPGERRNQVRKLLNIIEQQEADTVVLMGDLNEWFLWGRPLRWLRKHFRKTSNPATFPSRFPLFALDRIWVEPASQLMSVRRYKSTLAKTASDHLPLLATLQYQEKSLRPKLDNTK